MTLELPGDPNAPDVRHVLAVVTGKAGCESCGLAADLAHALARARGQEEAAIRLEFGMPPRPVEALRAAGTSTDTRDTGQIVPEAVSGAERGRITPMGSGGDTA